MLPKDETWLAKDDRFCRAGVSYRPTLCQKVSNSTACQQTQEAGNIAKPPLQLK